MNHQQFWRAVGREAKAILIVSGGITTALWIKRLIEQLANKQIIDKDIVKHGLDRSVPAPIPKPSTPVWETETFHSDARPWPVNGSRRGEVVVDGWEGLVHVPYTAMYRTRDGLTLYRHDTELHPEHVCGPCPLLKARTPCEDCEWFVEPNTYDDDPRCAAVVKLHSSPQDFTTSVADIKRQLDVW
jgi:hypothetical protein